MLKAALIGFAVLYAGVLIGFNYFYKKRKEEIRDEQMR